MLGVATEVLDIHDGELEPTLENRKTITRLIREWKADIVIAHRPWDYHPDHRYVGVLVQDAAYMVAVPHFCPDTPPLKSNPRVPLFQRRLPEAVPLQARHRGGDRRRDRHEARRACTNWNRRLYEGGALGSEEAFRLVPPATDPAGPQGVVPQGALLVESATPTSPIGTATALVEWYGPEKGKAVKYAEAFEICEYGRRVTPEEIKKLFPFYE